MWSIGQVDEAVDVADGDGAETGPPSSCPFRTPVAGGSGERMILSGYGE